MTAISSCASPNSEFCGQAMGAERLWQELVSDASPSWEHMSPKNNIKYLDYEHEKKRETLWIPNSFTTPGAPSRFPAVALREEHPSSSFSASAEVEEMFKLNSWEQAEVQFEGITACLGFDDDKEIEDQRLESHVDDCGLKSKHSILLEEERGTEECMSGNPGRHSNVCLSVGVDYSRELENLCQEGRLKEALHILNFMVQYGIGSSNTYACLLQSCGRLKALTVGKEVHAYIRKTGFMSNIFLGNMTIDMYAKCGSMLDAREVFDRMPKRNVYSWTAIISAYAKDGQAEEAIKLFWEMQQACVVPDKVVFLIVLQACASPASLEHGKQIHGLLKESGLSLDVVLESALVKMYAKCGSLDQARTLFDKMHRRDMVSWTVMIAGYVQYAYNEEALRLFYQMQSEGIKPGKATMICVLKACASLSALVDGKKVHAQIIEYDFESDMIIGTTLVDMYAKCGGIEVANQIFNKMRRRNVVTWNVMIAAYAQQGLAKEAFQLFEQMQKVVIEPDMVSFVSILKACNNSKALDKGKEVHTLIVERGFELDRTLSNTLIDMYAKCGKIENGFKVFNKMFEQDVVSWNALIAGCAQHGLGEEALRLFKQMQQEGIQPDEVTFVGSLGACSTLAAMEQGRQIHFQIMQRRVQLNSYLASSLVDMYAKCGSIEDARQVFDEMQECDVVLWNTMIGAYAQHGLGKEVLTLFEQMQQENVKPTESTFLSILSGCSHAGLVDEGRRHFDSMVQDYGVTPTKEHYACIVDLLARSGHVQEAQEFIRKIPFSYSEVAWTTLLGATRMSGNVDIAKHAVEHVLQSNPQNSSAYVLLSNIYAAAGQWDNSTKMRQIVKERGVEKEPGHSCIEINGCAHFWSERCNTSSNKGN